MTTNFINNSPYLRTTRDFPKDEDQLQRELSRSYIDVATAVNNRSIGIYPTNRPAITGNSWYLTSDKQQTIRQVYRLSGAANIPLGFKLSTISDIVFAFGSYSNGTSKYGLIYGTNVVLAGQVVFWIEVDGASTTSDLIRFNVGAGAPTIDSGNVVIEWLSKV